MSEKNPKVSIIIINFGGVLTTLACLEALQKTTYPKIEVILVDNGSQFQKNELAIIRKKFGRFIQKIIANKHNLGFASGNNIALKLIKTKYVVLLNNDVIVEPDWLEPLIMTMEQNSKIAAVQPKIRWFLKPDFFEYAGGAGGFLDIFGYPFTRGRVIKILEKDKGQYDQASEIAWASGAAMALRKSVLDKVGLFDRNFFNYIEEIDLCLRIWRSGFKIICVPSSLVFHLGGFTSNRNIFFKNYWLHHNNLMLLIKHYSTRQLLFNLPARLGLNFLNLLYYLSQKELKSSLAIVLAHLRIIYHLPKIIKARRAFNKLLQKNHLPNGQQNQFPVFPKSIIWHYFILKRKTYREIVSLNKRKNKPTDIFHI